MHAKPSFITGKEWRVICEKADGGDKEAIDFKKSVEQFVAKAKGFAQQESAKEKKNRNHEVFIVGGAILNEMSKNPSFRDVITKVIDRNVRKKSDIQFLTGRGWSVYEKDDSDSGVHTASTSV